MDSIYNLPNIPGNFFCSSGLEKSKILLVCVSTVVVFGLVNMLHTLLGGELLLLLANSMAVVGLIVSSVHQI